MPTTASFYATRVGIVGAGGLGSNLAILLCRMGFSRLVIADYDIVEPSNLNRQVYLYKQVGRPKVEALAQIVLDLLPEIELLTHFQKIDERNIARPFENCGVFVDCTDSAQNKSRIVEAALTVLDCPVVSASGIGGRLTPAKISCSHRFGGRLWVIGDQQSSDCLGVAAPAVIAAASALAEAVYDICRLRQESP
ncbi:MAG: sulfur carrier protein ThiS adenylyltransferase ThiF [Deltaproteobacteria bacterium]|nr:sulfur carrier protein ThiS adenylyltransferase ThiF [Deltaproteobacteria bacterium]